MRFRRLNHGVMARGRPANRRKPGTMNGLEAAFYEYAKSWRGVVSIDYEKITLKLADDTRYTPDFYVLMDSGAVQFYECKGFMEDHARVKIKVAAAMFPEFEFYLVRKVAKRHGGGWDIKLMGGDK